MTNDFHRLADAALARGDAASAIAALDAGVDADPTDSAAWMKLAALRRRAGDTTRALEAVHALLAMSPHDFLALLLKAGLHEQRGEDSAAAEIYQAALFHAPDPRTLPPPVRSQLDRARAFLAAWRAAIDADMARLPDLDDQHRRRARRLVDNVVDRRPDHHQQPTHYRYPGLADIEYFDDAYAAFRQRLAAAYPAIRAEYEQLVQRHADRERPYVDFAPGQPVGQWSALNRSTDWNALHLLRYGEADPVNAAACPATLAAFAGDEQASIPGLGPNLMFSLLAPHAHIPPHHGVANFRVVCHLPITVPPDCRFRVGGDTREWVEGQPWIFDDTIEHEAWNDSGERRVVLIGDLWRPELDEQDRLVVQRFMTAQDGEATRGAL